MICARIARGIRPILNENNRRSVSESRCFLPHALYSAELASCREISAQFVLDGVAVKLGQTRDREDEGDLRVTQFGCRWRGGGPACSRTLFCSCSDSPPAHAAGNTTRRVFAPTCPEPPGSYQTVSGLAKRKEIPLAWLVPVGIDGGLIGVVVLDLVLSWIGQPIGWLRQFVQVLTVGTVAANAAAGWPDLVSAGLHIAAPLMLLAMVEAGVSPRHGLRLKKRGREAPAGQHDLRGDLNSRCAAR
jgi:hypothetical protein